jgi:hypothetical protein
VPAMADPVAPGREGPHSRQDTQAHRNRTSKILQRDYHAGSLSWDFGNFPLNVSCESRLKSIFLVCLYSIFAEMKYYVFVTFFATLFNEFRQIKMDLVRTCICAQVFYNGTFESMMVVFYYLLSCGIVKIIVTQHATFRLTMHEPNC